MSERAYFLFVPWTLDARFPGNVYAEGDDDALVLIGHFDEHIHAADAVAAHNAVLLVRA